ncbi:MAG: OmpA family protein [Chitinophagaceae bacterium]|nr:OmpA family protein [Chitinophagaceae bacterium]
MASKKYKLLLGLLTLITLGSYAQDSGVYNIYDSSVISSKGMAQQNEFMNNTYDFPAKPRNQLEVGISGGAFTISGDVRAKFPTIGGAVHIRKALGYLFSLRLQYLYGIGKGEAFKSSNNFDKNPAWAKYGAARRTGSGQIVSSLGPGGPIDNVFYNYKSKVQDLSLQGIFTVNNIRFHKQKTGMVIYGGLGIGGTIYHTMVNALDANGQTYATLFNTVAAQSQTYKNRKQVLDALKKGMDDTYETEAENQGTRRPRIGNNTFKPSGTVLGGLAFKLGKRINLALEDRFTIVKDDLLDGQQWAEQTYGDAVLTGDYDAYNYASIGLNFNLGSKSVEPLWWLNPLDYAYSEINNPRHMKLPKPILDDTDGDGVIDQLDKEPNTPAGCAVDTHGVSLDTDGDGVPDCKDKEKITPTYCQPVDADGVGKCPDPACCQNRMAMDSTMNTCTIGDLPSVSFRGNMGSLSADAKAMLATVASKMKNSANCNITITGYPAASKASQALCNRRTGAVKTYLMETEGISGDRISVNCEVGGGDANTIDIKGMAK